MKSASRRQVKTPVGKKTKRGAELEGTPKTPRSLEASPAKPASVDGSSIEPDDRRPQLRSRRPLQWTIITKQKIVGDGELGENTMSPSQQQAQLKCTGGSKGAAALSPICVNAIPNNAGQDGGAKKACIKKSNELPPAVILSPSVSNCDGVPERVWRGKAKALDWSDRNIDDPDDARSTDEGSCPSTPDVPSSGKQMFFWSNAAFNTHEPGQQEAVSLSKDAASSSGCSTSSASSSRQIHEASIARADSEAESKFYDSSAEDGHTHINGRESFREDDRQKGAMLPESCTTMDPVQRPSNSSLKAEENAEREHANGCISSMTNKNLFESGGKSSLAANNLDAGHVDFPPFTSAATKQPQAGNERGLQAADDAAEDKVSAMKGALDEIQQEIERLTERLAELHLQKRKREEEIQRQYKQSKNYERATGNLVKVPGNDEKSGEEKRGAGAGAGGNRMKEINGAGSSRSPLVRHKSTPKIQPQKTNRLAATSREESPLAPIGRRGQGPTASVSKLSEMRRSVSSTGRRIERSNGDERTKALRRLSLGGAATSTSSESKTQKQQGVIKPLQPCKSTPSRIVSSRYGRPITPDACRPCAPGGSISSKKRDRPSSASAASSPLPAPSPSPSASVVCSPLKRAATLRSGYPSRSGLSTPTKDRHAVSKSSAMVSSSVQLPPSTLSSSLTKSQDRTHLLLSSPRCMSPLPRLDSPKSTAALYKCLESLLEDSKHFFKRLSPARPHRLPAQLEENAIAGAVAVVAASPASTATTLSVCDCSPKQLLAAMESALPTINTCRLDALSPRDSGCVKRALDRQKKRFYFAQEEDGILEEPFAGILST
ncbi:hypothetical protein GOP47_0002628 [Adiantum capillus-veneris]|uniref:Uncharacterized protein n=1 Tax=Adiantum capillus-veneris TaxID=13818 RepID=A0A9D4ZRT0_ADICA|nr:hypothetical protein GOP47_0002628 [Adiantum capillus-veneris]